MSNSTEVVISTPPEPTTYDMPADEIAAGVARQVETQEAIAAILAEVTPKVGVPPAEPEVVPTAPAAPVIAAAVTATAPVTEPVSSNPAPTATETDRGWMRLMELEGQVRSRVEAAEAREKQLKALETELTQKFSGHIDPKDFVNRFTLEPSKTLEALGLSPEVVSAMIVVDRLGDKAPAEARKVADGFQVKREIEQLRRQLQERDYYLAKERALVGAKDFVGSTSTGESKYPTLSAVAAVDKDMVANAVLTQVEQMARNPGFQLNQDAYAQAAANVEKTWEVFARAFKPAASTNVSGAPATASPAQVQGKQNPPPPAPPAPVTPAPAATKSKRPYWEDPEWESAKRTALDEALRSAGVQR